MLLDLVGRVAVREKGPADLVTEADLASQETIRRVVLGRFPDHSWLGEEDIDQNAPATESAYRWIADPLDGTTNFVHGVPHYCVSLALQYHGRVIAATVFDPTNRECFTAGADSGAFLNGNPISTSAISDLGNALAVVGFPPRMRSDCPDLLVFLKAIECAQAIRRTGSAALNLCYLACGRFDVFWSFSTKIWDVAAGALILSEAGGTITSPSGGDFVPEEANFLAAANNTLHDRLVEMVEESLT